MYDIVGGWESQAACVCFKVRERKKIGNYILRVEPEILKKLASRE